jgi:hypothetical protein
MHNIDATATTVMYIKENATRECYAATQREEGNELCNFKPAKM